MEALKIEVGRTYRLVRPLEVRDERTGTLKHYLLKGTLLIVRKLVLDVDQVWVEGLALPLPLGTLPRHVVPADQPF